MSFSSDFRQTVTKLQLHGTDRPKNSSLLQHRHSCPKPISFNQIQTKYYPQKKRGGGWGRKKGKKKTQNPYHLIKYKPNITKIKKTKK